jgi:hypothetical protein
MKVLVTGSGILAIGSMHCHPFGLLDVVEYREDEVESKT